MTPSAGAGRGGMPAADFAASDLAGLGAGTQFVFRGEDFERVRRLIRDKAGIDLHEQKQSLVYGRLARRLRERGHESFRDYLDSMQGDADPEWQEFINCLTTNLTSFFREAHHFQVLAEFLSALPAGARPALWSCAASTGEEPYSMAMTALQTLGEGAQVTIDASDIDTRVLAVARNGIYSLEAVSALDEALLRRFFLKGSGANGGKAQIKPRLRAMVAFRHFNLLSQAWPVASHDVVFCRNVMIYFDAATQRQVLQRLHRCLRPGGLLVVGHSENFTGHPDLFQLIGRTTYRRFGDSP